MVGKDRRKVGGERIKGQRSFERSDVGIPRSPSNSGGKKCNLFTFDSIHKHATFPILDLHPSNSPKPYF